MTAIYEGTLKHTRTKPKKHAFEYQVRLLYLDLDDLKNIFSNSKSVELLNFFESFIVFCRCPSRLFLVAQRVPFFCFC